MQSVSQHLSNIQFVEDIRKFVNLQIVNLWVDFLVSLPEIFMKCQMSKLLIEFFFYFLHWQCNFFIFFALAMQVFNIFCVGIASFFLFFGFWSRDLFTNLRFTNLQCLK